MADIEEKIVAKRKAKRKDKSKKKPSSSSRVTSSSLLIEDNNDDVGQLKSPPELIISQAAVEEEQKITKRKSKKRNDLPISNSNEGDAVQAEPLKSSGDGDDTATGSPSMSTDTPRKNKSSKSMSTDTPRKNKSSKKVRDKKPGAYSAMSSDLSSGERLKFGTASSSSSINENSAKMPGAHLSHSNDMSAGERLKFGVASGLSSTKSPVLPGAQPAQPNDMSAGERLKFGVYSASKKIPGARASQASEMSARERHKVGGMSVVSALSTSAKANIPGATAANDADISAAYTAKFGLKPIDHTDGKLSGSYSSTDADVSAAERAKFGSMATASSRRDTGSELIGAKTATDLDVSNAERLKLSGTSSSKSSKPRVQEATDDAAARFKFSMTNAERLKFGEDIEPDPEEGEVVEFDSESNHRQMSGLSVNDSSRSLNSTRTSWVSQRISRYPSNAARRLSRNSSGMSGSDQVDNTVPRDEETPIEASCSSLVETNRASSDQRRAESSRSYNSKKESIRIKAREDGWRSLCFLSSCVSFVIVMGLAIGLGVAKRSGRSAEASATTHIGNSASIPPPTSTPTKAPEDFAWCYESNEDVAMSKPPYAKMRSALVRSGISIADEFFDDTSYQRKALCWLAFGDRKELDVSDPFLEQRYILAAIFYRFNEPSKLVDDGWLTGNSECEWKPSVECDARTETTVSRLQLSGISATGSLPKEISSLLDVTHLDLSINEFDGDISDVAGGWLHLMEVKLSSNRFTSIPSSILDWKDLNHFDISNNELLGIIPESLTLSRQLIYLDLALNQFQGTIPTSFGNLLSLQTLYLHGNELEGSVPPSLCDLRTNEVLVTLSADCTTVLCDCCTVCDDYNVGKNALG